MTGLPGIDFPIADLTADQLDERAAHLVARCQAAIPPVQASDRAWARYRRRRSKLAYGAVLCRFAARVMRAHGAETYDDLTYEQCQQVVNQADDAMKQIAAGEPVPAD